MQNPHPLLVHFPIAFLAAFAAATLLGLVVRRPGLAGFARSSLFVGAAAAALATGSGFLAEQGVAPVAAAAGSIAEHRLFAYLTLALAALLCALEAVAPRHPGRAGAFRAARAVGALLLLGILVQTAHEGGELVHEHGVGTALTAPGGPLHEGAPAGVAPRPAPGAPAPTGRDFR